MSHWGYDKDLEMAALVDGVDVIVGGHTHTALGDMASFGIKTAGAYPTVVKTPNGGSNLVVTDWQWANTIGVLNLEFDPQGRISSYSGNPKLLAGQSKFRIYDLLAADGSKKRVEFTKAADGSWSIKENDGKAYAALPDPASLASYQTVLDHLLALLKADQRVILVDEKPAGVDLLAKYSPAIKTLQAKLATTASDDLKRGNNQGPGPLIADSMTWKTGAQVAVMNPGGVRVDLAAGPVTVARVYELQPFGNTLVTMNLKGAELIQVLEDMCDFCITSYGKTPGTAYAYVSGVKFTLTVAKDRGQRVSEVMVKDAAGAYKNLDPAASYSVVVNNFMASGGDKNFTLGALEASRKYDTGFIDSEAMLDFVLGKTIANPSEVRINTTY